LTTNTGLAFFRAPEEVCQRGGFTFWAGDPVHSVGLVGRVPTFGEIFCLLQKDLPPNHLYAPTSLCGDVASWQCEFHTRRLVEISFFRMKEIL
jgi:hypothetical protein